MIARSSVVRSAGFCVIVALVATNAWAVVERLPLRVAGSAADSPVASLEIAGETRPLFATSGRRTLAIQPAEVGAGGRLFAYAPVPAGMGADDFMAELLVWNFARPGADGTAARVGGWRRVALAGYRAATGNTVSATIVDPQLDVGPIVTGVFARAAAIPEGRVANSSPVEVPGGARLRFAYGVDELDTRLLAPVTISVTAVIEKRAGEVERVEIFRRDLVPLGGSLGWTDLTADLSKLSGDRVTFEFRSRVNAAEGALATHIAWATPVILHEERGKPPPTVILISLANVRAKSMSCCGASHLTTPFLDGFFGSEGAIFQRVLTEAVDPMTSHMSLLTGASPCSHGVRSGRTSLDASVRTLAERFTAAGYATGGFTDGGGLVSELGFSRGFDVYVERAGASFDKALSWLESRDGEPVFLFLHAWRGAADLISYEGNIRRFDDELRAFLLKLDQLVDPDHVVVAITSGHGEEFSEHGSLGHGTHLFEESVRVPLLLRGGGVKRGLRPAAVMGVIDIAPTLLQLAGQQVPNDVEGVARGDELRSGAAWSTEIRFVEASSIERRSDSGVVPNWRPPGYAVVEGPVKLIRDGDGSSYLGFNLSDDADERRNLVAEVPSPEWTTRLRQALDAHAVSCEGLPGASSPTPILCPESRFELRGLGYPE